MPRNTQDNPRFSWRGFMLDESRHFFGKEKVMQSLDIMASLHLNVFHWRRALGWLYFSSLQRGNIRIYQQCIG